MTYWFTVWRTPGGTVFQGVPVSSRNESGKLSSGFNRRCYRVKVTPKPGVPVILPHLGRVARSKYHV